MIGEKHELKVEGDSKENASRQDRNLIYCNSVYKNPCYDEVSYWEALT